MQPFKAQLNQTTIDTYSKYHLLILINIDSIDRKKKLKNEKNTEVDRYII
jgi:hypothetical protein